MKKKLKALVFLTFGVVIFLSFKRITDHSMHPIFRKGDFIIISPFVDMLELGDVVVIRDPLDQRSHLVRRIIAIGPEKIALNSNGTLYVGGDMIEQKELDHDENYRYIEEIQYDKDTQKKWRIVKRLDIGTDLDHSFVVSSDRIFLLADNRDEFIDSRLWGSLRHENVIGKVVLRIGTKDPWQDYIFFP